MQKGSGVLIPDRRVEQSTPAPRLKLLVDWESRPKVFFSNLADLLLFREVKQPFLTSRPAAFWPDVFVPSGHPWFSFLESSLGHLLLIILVVWAQSRIWEPVRLFPKRDAFRGSITYTPPAPSFQASEGRVSKRASKKEARSRVKRTSPHQPAMAVRREPTPGIVTPPDLKQAMASLPNLPNSHPVTPMAPLSATAGARRNALAGPSGVVAPPPQVDQAATRALGLPQASGVAPAPELGAASARRNLASANSGSERIVPPPPSVQAGNSPRRGGISSISGTGANVVPPPPSVQGTGKAVGDARLGSMAGGSHVIPPPPSVQGGGNSPGTGRGDWPYAASSQVVPPPPSIQSAGGPGGSARSAEGLGNNSGTGGRVGSLSGDGSQVIPPPPSVGGAGSGSGLGGRAGSLSGDGSQVIPPPPSVGGGGNGSGLGGRAGSLSGGGSQVIPPPPSVGGGGGGTGIGGRLGSLSGDGSQVVPPPPSVGGGGGSGTGGRLGGLSGDGPEVAPPSSAGNGSGNGAGNGASAGGGGRPLEPLPLEDSPTTTGKNENKPAAEEVPLAALGLVFAAPGTSFFSNFEVFVAKRKMGKDKLVLMKLVYEFLPYQRRLSEYHLDDLPPRVIKLKVTPDPSCNETLGHMIEPHPNANSAAAESLKLPEELQSADMNAVLPCYRTTADDFQKAMARAR